METDSVGGEALTSFENTASKQMREYISILRERAAQATPEDKTLVESLRKSGAGIRPERITPPVAAIVVLFHNQFNRAISLTKVRQMMEDLKSNEWRYHHQGIAFTANGDLADGQHRLVACGVCGTAMKVAVAADFDMVAIDSIDRSTRRTLEQTLQMRGVPDSKDKVHIGKIVIQSKHAIDHGIRANFSEHRLHRELRAIDQVLSEGLKLGKASVRGVSEPSLDWKDASAVATLLLMSRWDAPRIGDYLVAAQEGTGTYDKAPTILLAELLKKKSGKDAKDKLTTTQRIALTLKAAILFTQNKRTQKLVWNEHEEGMPDPTLPDAAAAAAE